MNTSTLVTAFASLLVLSSAPAAHADAKSGQAVFSNVCSRCHTGGIAALKTDPARLGDVLRAGRIAKHRFVLSDKQLGDLVDYATAAKK